MRKTNGKVGFHIFSKPRFEWLNANNANGVMCFFGTPLEPWPADATPCCFFSGKPEPGRGMSLWPFCDCHAVTTQGINAGSGGKLSDLPLSALVTVYFLMESQMDCCSLVMRVIRWICTKSLKSAGPKTLAALEPNRWSPVNTWGSYFWTAFATTTLVQEDRVDSEPLETEGWDLEATTCEAHVHLS